MGQSDKGRGKIKSVSCERGRKKKMQWKKAARWRRVCGQRKVGPEEQSEIQVRGSIGKPRSRETPKKP